jgi:(1->4)-alpha-D-glucan 1-alpha-D-glucosylmutase
MVDPDNRRPVDWAARRRMLAALQRAHGDGAGGGEWSDDLAAGWRDGREKLFLVWRALQVRAREPLLFREGTYVPLVVSGEKAAHVCAFARQHEGRTLLVAAPRLIGRLMREGAAIDWSDTAVEVPVPATWHDALGGTALGPRAERIAVAELFRNFPVALLIAA